MSAAALAAVATWSAMRAPGVLAVTSTLAGLAGVSLTIALLRRVELFVGIAVALAASAYAAATLAPHGSFDQGAPFVGTSLVLSAELATLSIEAAFRPRLDPLVVRARVRAFLVLSLAGFLIAVAATSTISVQAPRSAAWTLVGAFAILAMLGVIAQPPIPRLLSQLIRRSSPAD